MIHSLNNDPHALPSNEMEHGTRHPARFEPKQQTVGNTQPQQRMRAHVHSSVATQSIPDTTPTIVTFTVNTGFPDFDTAGLFTPSKFTIPSTGRITGAWYLHGYVVFDAAAAGARHLHLRKNGTTIIVDCHEHGTNDQQSLDVHTLINDPNAGDFFELIVAQTSGGALNILKAPEECFFEIIHLW